MTAEADPANVLRGLQAGGTTTLTITGGDLLPEPKLVLPLAIAQQVLKEGAAANQVQIDVTLDAATPQGIYQLRLATAQGISAPLNVAVDRLPELPFAAEVTSLPVALKVFSPEPYRDELDYQEDMGRIGRVAVVDCNRGDNVRFDAGRNVDLHPIVLLAGDAIFLIEPANESGCREARRIDREICFDCFQWKTADRYELIEMGCERIGFEVAKQRVVGWRL